MPRSFNDMSSDPSRRRRPHGGRHERAPGGENGPMWLALGLGALAGAAGLAYLTTPQRSSYRPADTAPGRTARRRRFGGKAVVGRTVTIDRPSSELHAFWHDFSNLPRFMENVEAVENADADTWRWRLAAPAGRTVEVLARITTDRPGDEIAWRSVEGSQIDTSGKIHFRDAPGGRGTEVEAVIAYVPPGGEAGRWLAAAFGKEPAIQGRRELKRLKMLMETGEVATSANRRSDPR